MTLGVLSRLKSKIINNKVYFPLHCYFLQENTIQKLVKKFETH